MRKDIDLKIREEEQKRKDQKELKKKLKEQKLKAHEDELKKDLESQKIKEWEDKFDEEQKLRLEEEKLKDNGIKQRARLRQVIEEQSDQNLQDELFSKLEAFEVDKSKEN